MRGDEGRRLGFREDAAICGHAVSTRWMELSRRDGYERLYVDSRQPWPEYGWASPVWRRKECEGSGSARRG